MMKKTLGANIIIVFFLVLVLGFSFILAGGLPDTTMNNPYVVTPTPAEVVAVPKDMTSEKSLQLQTFPYTTIAPTVPETTIAPTTFIPAPTFPAGPTPVSGGNYCPLDRRHGPECTCAPNRDDNLQCDMNICPAGASIVQSGAGAGCYILKDDPLYSQYVNNPNCGGYCVGKPVIYLYPTRDTVVNVSVKTAGDMVVSDPLYPAGGWQVLAHPGGLLSYRDKTYSELFYETSAESVKEPATGRIISTSNLASHLWTLTASLGLRESEQQEFLHYWLPRLSALHSPYLFFSVLEPSEKKRLDDVTISPKPDVFIDFIVYFKPLQVPFTTKAYLLLPETPKRHGFTAVEWGGVIARE